MTEASGLVQEQSATKFVVGLGNPERRYEGTRHNVGFAVLAALRQRWEFGPAKEKFHSLICTGRVRLAQVVLAAPQTYMNRSGLAVAELMSFYKLQPSDVLIVLDDLALPPGRLRARADGSAGGHNGLADIIQAVGTDAIPRVRVGIGPPPPQVDQVAYVLGRFSPQEEPVMLEAIAQAASAVEDWAEHGITYVMTHYNRDAGSSAAGAANQ